MSPAYLELHRSDVAYMRSLFFLRKGLSFLDSLSRFN